MSLNVTQNQAGNSVRDFFGHLGRRISAFTQGVWSQGRDRVRRFGEARFWVSKWVVAAAFENSVAKIREAYSTMNSAPKDGVKVLEDVMVAAHAGAKTAAAKAKGALPSMPTPTIAPRRGLVAVANRIG